MKSYTDIEQSKKLVEILPLESADMYYHYNFDFDELESIPVITEEDDHFILFPKDIGCWNLTALLSVLPFPTLLYDIKDGEGRWIVSCEKNDKGYLSYYKDNPVDTCYEMIIKLNELNLL